MKMLKNRKFAILLTVAVAITATLLGVRATAGRYTRRIEAMFNDGVYIKSDNYTQPGINTHLENCLSAALGVATMLESYPKLEENAKTLLTARRELLTAKTVKEKDKAFESMRDSFINLLNKAKSEDLTQRDKDAAAQHYKNFNGALGAMQNSRFNEKVAEYLDGQGSITKVLASITLAKIPSYFTTSPFPEAVWP